jgi:hypothetical protein
MFQPPNDTHPAPPPPPPPIFDHPPESFSDSHSNVGTTGLVGARLRVVVGVTVCGLLLAATGAGLVVGHYLNTATRGVPVQPADSTSPTPAGAILSAPPATPGSLVDSTEAARVLDAMWSLREQALADRDASAVARLETGPAAQWDMVRCTFGCPAPQPRPMLDTRLFVPRQSAYPAAFLAEVRTTTDDHLTAYIEIMVFVRQGAAHPWMVALDTGYSGFNQMAGAPASDSSGFDQAAPVFPGIDPSALPGRLASYWQHWKDVGGPPSGSDFDHGVWTDLQGQHLYAYRQQLLANGEVEHATYSADPSSDGEWTFALDENANGHSYTGWAISCGTVLYTAVITPGPGSALIQPADQSEWGTLLQPGSYAQITNKGLHQSCFLLQPGYTTIGVVGGNGDVIQVTGIPAIQPT